MKAQAIINADYLDILFENRNKAYGGYALRKNENSRMRNAFFLLVGLCATAIASTMLPKPDDIPAIKNDTPVTLVDPTQIIPPKPKPIELEPVAAASKPTVKNPTPVIVADAKVIIPPPTVDSFAGRESGPVTNKGEIGGTALKHNQHKDTGAGESPLIPSKPLIYAQVMPDFIGDIYAYLAKNVRYPATAIASGIEGRVIVQFVVNEDGSISNSKILRGIGGGCDNEALRVINAMPDWKPGIQNGNAVKVYFTLPIAFRLE